MAYLSLVDQAQQFVAAVIREGDVAIDATVGNGHDTVFLAKAVGETGHVFGFDVQSAALDTTLERLQREHLEHRVSLIQQSHARACGAIPSTMKPRIKAVMFNLGYLPGGDKSLITRRHSTLQALNAVLPQVLFGGVITIVAYRGHGGGEEESAAVREWAEQLDKSRFTSQRIHSPTASEKAPVLHIIRRNEAK